MQKKLPTGRAPPTKRCKVAATSSAAVSDDMEALDICVSLQPPEEEVQHIRDIGVQFSPPSDHTYGTKTASTKSTATQTDLPTMSAYDLDGKD